MNTIISKFVERWASKKLGVMGALFVFCLQPEVQMEVKAIVAIATSIWTVIQGQVDKAKEVAKRSKVLVGDFKETREEKTDEKVDN